MRSKNNFTLEGNKMGALRFVFFVVAGCATLAYRAGKAVADKAKTAGHAIAESPRVERAFEMVFGKELLEPKDLGGSTGRFM